MTASVREGASPTPSGIRFPSGQSLSPELWQRRHRGVLWLLAAHAVALPLFGWAMGNEPAHLLLEGAIVAVIALVAAQPRLGRRARAIVASFGLMSTSAILTHLSGGYIEAHFHFFVMLGVVFLYEDWVPYVVAVAYVALHHGVVGTLDPLSVFNHAGAVAQPWLWASIHASFILGLSAALLIAWNVIETARASETHALGEAQEAKRQLHAQEKMAALGSLIAGLAHEVRTPLTVISTNASLIEMAARKGTGDASMRRIAEHVGEVQANVDRINGLVLQLRRFHALAPEEMQVVPLDAVVRDAVRLFLAANKVSREVRLDLVATSPAPLHLLGIHQVVLNLVANAVEATDPAKGVVTVRTSTQGEHVVLLVEDNGVGMSEETQRRAFDPLFTTKPHGMGLGLHIVKRIVDAHQGDVRVRSEEGKGTTFEVRFPAASLPGATRSPVPVALEGAPLATSP